MRDVFDHTILCERCHLKMKRADVQKNGYVLRAVKCDNCGDRIVHPRDLHEYEQFNQIRNKTFHVKLRMVGNSYAVSIPREIVQFMHEQEKMMDDMVRLCFQDMKRLSLSFGNEIDDEDKEEKRKVALKEDEDE